LQSFRTLCTASTSTVSNPRLHQVCACISIYLHKSVRLGPAFRTDPARQSTRSDGWTNIRQMRATLSRPLTDPDCCDWTLDGPPSLLVPRTGSRTVNITTAASTMPGIPLIIQDQRQPCKMHQISPTCRVGR